MPAADASRLEPTCALLVVCVECGEGVEVPLPIDQRTITLLLARRGWFMSVVSPPGQGPEVAILMAALCAACAKKVYPPAVFRIAELAGQERVREEDRRLLLLQGAQASQGTR